MFELAEYGQSGLKPNRIAYTHTENIHRKQVSYIFTRATTLSALRFRSRFFFHLYGVSGALAKSGVRFVQLFFFMSGEMNLGEETPTTCADDFR